MVLMANSGLGFIVAHLRELILSETLKTRIVKVVFWVRLWIYIQFIWVYGRTL